MENLENEIKNAKILIVDDLPENLQVLGSTLNSKSYRVAFATSGKQAIGIAQSKTPDLILLDIQMPEMDGYETCKLLKQDNRTKDIPVIFLTAKNDIEDIVTGLQYGAVDYITKPFNQLELLARVSTHLKVKYYQDYIFKQNTELLASQAQIAKDAQKLIALNEDLMESENQLKASNKSKDKLFSIISHDLRGPFAGLLGLGQLMVDEFDNLSEEEKKDMIVNIFQASNRLFNLVENLLVWSRSQLNSIEFSPENTSVIRIIDKTALYYTALIEKKRITMETIGSEDLKAFCDSAMLATVMRNLISNAIKFTPVEGKISIQATKYSDSEILIEVCDTGVGMPPEDIVNVFQLDIKVSNPGTEDEPGTGLGLMLCKEFIEKQNGRIWIESELEVGTKVCFTLPVVAH